MARATMTADSNPLRAADIVERLASEHDNVTRLLLALESALAELNSGHDVDFELLRRVQRFASETIDERHHRGEMRAFQALARLRPALTWVIDAIGAEHDRIHADGVRLGLMFERTLVGEPLARRTLARAGFTYVTDVRRCLALEEETLHGELLRLSPAEVTVIVEALGSAGDGRGDDARARATYAELTRAIGCGCEWS